jgi:hypothetical protein
LVVVAGFVVDGGVFLRAKMVGCKKEYKFGISGVVLKDRRRSKGNTLLNIVWSLRMCDFCV